MDFNSSCCSKPNTEKFCAPRASLRGSKKLQADRLASSPDEFEAHQAVDDEVVVFTGTRLESEAPISFISSIRGRELILYGGFKFSRHRFLANGQTSWRCVNRTCAARLKFTVDDTTITEARLDHNHPPPNPEQLERQKLTTAVKKKALESISEPPSSVIKAVLSKETATDKFTKGDVIRMRKNLCRARRKHVKRSQELSTEEQELYLSADCLFKSEDDFAFEMNDVDDC